MPTSPKPILKTTRSAAVGSRRSISRAGPEDSGFAVSAALGSPPMDTPPASKRCALPGEPVSSNHTGRSIATPVPSACGRKSRIPCDGCARTSLRRGNGNARISNQDDELCTAYRKVEWLLAPKPEPPMGAHVVTQRRAYTHHGIYVGSGKVIHYAGLAQRSGGRNFSLCLCRQ